MGRVWLGPEVGAEADWVSRADAGKHELRNVIQSEQFSCNGILVADPPSEVPPEVACLFLAGR